MDNDPQNLLGESPEEVKSATDRILEVLAGRYREEFFIPEFRDKPSGFSHRIDALAIWLHPSRSKEIECFEIKTLRGDWLKELDSPLKSDSIAKHCDRIWLVTSNERIARLDEIPKNWGWMYLKNNRLKVIKEAPELNPIFDKDFIITVAQYARDKSKFLLRDAEFRGYERGVKMGKEMNTPESIKKDYTYEMEKLRDYENKWTELQKITGIDFIGWETIDGISEVGHLVKAIREMKEKNNYEWIEERLEKIQAHLNSTKIEFEKLKQNANL